MTLNMLQLGCLVSTFLTVKHLTCVIIVRMFHKLDPEPALKLAMLTGKPWLCGLVLHYSFHIITVCIFLNWLHRDLSGHLNNMLNSIVYQTFLSFNFTFNMLIFSHWMIGQHNIFRTSKVYLKPVCLNVQPQTPHEVQELLDIGHWGEGALACVEKLYNRPNNLHWNI